MNVSGGRVLSRREWLGQSLAAGATLTLTPALLAALGGRGQLPGRLPGGAKLIERAIPSSGELLPVISLGARPVGGASLTMQPADVAALKEVLRTLADEGGKIVDTLHGGPGGQEAVAKAANELRIQNTFFWVVPLFVTVPLLPGHEGPEPKVESGAVRAQFDERIAALNVPRIDLVQMLANTDIPTHLGVLRELKKEGRVRYIGVTDLAPPPGMKNMPFYDKLESVMRNEAVDFIGVDYSVGDRRVEEKILPLAQERKIGVMAYFPFDRSRIFKRASSTPLPEWAAEFDARTWAQFFLKYVVSHPAVTAVRVGTTKAEHMLDNLGGGAGRVPDEAMRKRMAEFVDSLPPTPAPPPAPAAPPAPRKPQAPQAPAVVLSAGVLDRYVGEYKYAAAGTIVRFRRDGDRLLVKSGTMPEAPAQARSETRFTSPWGAMIEFQVDGQGKVTGAIVEQGPHRIPLERK